MDLYCFTISNLKWINYEKVEQPIELIVHFQHCHFQSQDRICGWCIKKLNRWLICQFYKSKEGFASFIKSEVSPRVGMQKVILVKLLYRFDCVAFLSTLATWASPDVVLDVGRKGGPPSWGSDSLNGLFEGTLSGEEPSMSLPKDVLS